MLIARLLEMIEGIEFCMDRPRDRPIGQGKLIPSGVRSMVCTLARVRTLDVRYVLDVKDMLYLETSMTRAHVHATIRESASENNVKFQRACP